MMKKTLFLIFAILLAMAVKAQDFREFYTIGNDGSRVELNISDILDSDMRYCLLSAIAGDNNISYTLDEDRISVNVTYKNNDSSESFTDYFDRITDKLNSEYSEYLKADKETKGEIFLRWKESLPEDIFVFLFRLMLIESPAPRDGNQTCATSDPFCTTDVVTFHVEANPGGSCETGPHYGCLAPYTARPPFWFHMKIGVAGAFTIRMTNSANVDIDYCCWGPFDDPVTPCPTQLTQDKYIDCGSTGSATENCHIPSTAQVGKYYIMVITKYNQSTATNITFQKVANSGPGETDCGILPPLVENDGPYCVGETIHLSGNAQEGAAYSWSGPGGWNANGQNVTRPNCTLAMAGTYTCTITLGNQSNSAESEVEVFAQPTANFNATTVCLGEATQFTSTSTTNPSGQTITSYSWNFGDNTTSSEQNPTHTYAQPGDYSVSLTVACGDNVCTHTKTRTVTVNSQPVANAGNDSSVNYNNPATLTAAAVSGASYQWQPAEKINGNPNQQTVQTMPLQETTTFTLTVTNNGCSDSDQVTISVGAQMTASASISDDVICDGNSTSVSATASGGNGSFTYAWQAIPNHVTFDNPNARQTGVHPSQAGEYTITCVVNDGQTTILPQVFLTVNPAENEETTIAVCPSELPYILDLPNGTTQSFYEGTGTEGWHTTVPNEYGCNVNVSLYLTVNEVVENEFTFETCDEPYTFIDNGQVIKTLENTCVFDTVYPYGECEKHVTINFTRHNVYDDHNHDEYVSVNYPDHHCDSYTWPSNGQTYTQRGEYPHTFQTIHGCDSIVTLVLDEGNFSHMVDPGASSAMIVDTCKNYSGYYIWGNGEQHMDVYASGNDWQYTFIGASSQGCDSIGYLNLRLYERPSIGELDGEQLVLPGVVFMPYVYDYQVLDISGAGTENDYPLQPDDFTWTVLSYYNTPNRVHPNTDDYASTWVVSYPDNEDKSKVLLYVNAEGNAVLKCTIHTICGDVSIDKFIYTEGYQSGESAGELNYENLVNVYPNPTNGDIYIGYSQLLTSESLIISIYNYSGALIDQIYSNADSNVIRYSTGDMPNGMYLIRLTGTDFVVTKKFVLNR